MPGYGNRRDDELRMPPNAQMPQDAAAEASVLSAMILSHDVAEEAFGCLEADYFYVPAHKTIYKAMETLFSRGLPLDVVSLADYLNSQGELERIGGKPYLLDLNGDTLSLAVWQNHARILKRDATLRSLIEASAKVTALAFDAPEDTQEVVDQAEKLILGATDDALKDSYSTLEEVISAYYSELGDMAQSGNTEQGAQTGFPGVDKLLLGLRAGQMVVVGARPGVGKTSFALSLATNAASNGTTVALFSLEMSKKEIAQRLLAALSRVGLQDLRSCNIREDQWPQILAATTDLAQLPIMIDDCTGTTVTEIRAKARRMLRGKEDNALIIVDYLQLLSSPAGSGSKDNRATLVAEMSRGIKIMAKDLGVPVIALSQLNREVESRTGKTPQLSDLRESGAIEQDADIVMFLDRSMTDEEAEREDRPDKDVTNVIIAKNRSGPLGIVPLTFLPSSTKFVEVDSYHG